MPHLEYLWILLLPRDLRNAKNETEKEQQRRIGWHHGDQRYSLQTQSGQSSYFLLKSGRARLRLRPFPLSWTVFNANDPDGPLTKPFPGRPLPLV
jgi:hypothetical protein